MWPPPRSSRRWPSSCLDKIPVRLPEVELVRLDFLWQHAEAILIEFQLHGEVGRFVVGVPTEMVDVGVTVHDAGANLRTELDLGLRLALDNRTEVRLVDADDKNIRSETRDGVLREAERLGYRRTPVSINLKTGRTNTIGVIVPEMHTPYAAQVVAGIQNVLYKNNQKVMIAESVESPERERMNLQMMEEFMVDGLIVSMCRWRSGCRPACSYRCRV